MSILNLNNKILRGYISSRNIGGSFYPQSLQNLLIRSFALDKKINLQLSATEWNIKKSYLMLRSILNQKNDGIIFFSLFQLLDDKKNFLIFSKKILNKKKIMVFCLENVVISKHSELNLILNKLKLIKLINNAKLKLNLKSLKKMQH